jgi:hypothetical protein
MNEALARVARRISGVRVDISAQDVWLYLAAQYPGQAERYNSVLYLLEFRGTEPALLLEAARIHVQNTTLVKAGEETLVGSWFPTVAQFKKAIREAEGKRLALERHCLQILQYEDHAPPTLSELAEQLGVKEIDLDFFLPEYRYQMSQLGTGAPQAWAEDVENEDEKWEREAEAEEFGELPLDPYTAIWQASTREMGTWLPESKQWLEQAVIVRVCRGMSGAILELATSHVLVRDYVEAKRESLLSILNQHGREVNLSIEDVDVMVYEEVRV